MSDINLSALEDAVWLPIAAAVAIGAGFLWIVRRTVRKGRGNGGQG